MRRDLSGRHAFLSEPAYSSRPYWAARAFTRSHLAPPCPRLLYLIEVPASADGDTFVVLYSGDIGMGPRRRAISPRAFCCRWRARREHRFSSLSYLKPPLAGSSGRRSSGGDRALRRSLELRPKVILVGYSLFRADGLPLVVQQPRRRTGAGAGQDSMALISPTDRADMAFRGLSWFDMTLPNARPLAPALLTLGARSRRSASTRPMTRARPRAPLPAAGHY